MVSDGLVASELMVTVPEAFPADFGVKVMLKVALWDAPRLSGVVMPLIENALLSTEICEIETVDESLLVIVTVCDFVAPTVTLPKSSVAGLSAREPVPAPERETVWVPFEASLLMESVALNTAAALGVNETFRVPF